jgi:hypothetical protein
VTYRVPRDSRAGVSYAAANFDIAIAIVQRSHKLTPEMLAEVEEIKRILQEQTHTPVETR